MATEKQLAARTRWSNSYTMIFRPKANREPRTSWWIAHAAPTADRAAFTAAITQRQAARMLTADDFIRSLGKVI